MSCSYHREPIEIIGTVAKVRPYNPPKGRKVFKTIQVIWFSRINVLVPGDPPGKNGKANPRELYDFQEEGKPKTRTVRLSGRLPKVNERVRVWYARISKNNELRGCILKFEILEA